MRSSIKKVKEIQTETLPKHKPGDYVIARKSNGDLIGEWADDAVEQGYDIVFPQDVEDYYNVIDKARKTIDLDDNNHYNSIRKVESIAERYYGDNWKNRIRILQKKAKDETLDESDEITLEEAA